MPRVADLPHEIWSIQAQLEGEAAGSNPIGSGSRWPVPRLRAAWLGIRRRRWLPRQGDVDNRRRVVLPDADPGHAAPASAISHSVHTYASAARLIHLLAAGESGEHGRRTGWAARPDCQLDRSPEDMGPQPGQQLVRSRRHAFACRLDAMPVHPVAEPSHANCRPSRDERSSRPFPPAAPRLPYRGPAHSPYHCLAGRVNPPSPASAGSRYGPSARASPC